MKKYKIILTESERNVLVGLIDIAVKATGLPAVEHVLPILKLIRESGVVDDSE